MPLSEQEIKNLIEKAKTYIDPERVNLSNLQQALKCYDQIIENVPTHPHYFAKRADIKCMLTYISSLSDQRDFYFKGGIEDIDRAIEIDPDQGMYYRKRGQFLLSKLNDENIPDSKIAQLIGKVIADYRACISRTPSDPTVWLNLIEIHMLSRSWDEAVGIYGECKPYMNDKGCQLTRAWLGCLALTFASELVGDEDKEPLYDRTIQFDRLDDGVAMICTFLGKIREEGGYKEKLDKVDEINDLFIDHFAEWRNRGSIFEQLSRYEEALKSFDKAIELNPDSTLISFRRGQVLMKLNCNEEALKSFDKVLKLTRDRSEKVAVEYLKSGLLLKLGRHKERIILDLKRILTFGVKRLLKSLIKR